MAYCDILPPSVLGKCGGRKTAVRDIRAGAGPYRPLKIREGRGEPTRAQGIGKTLNKMRWKAEKDNANVGRSENVCW